MISWQGLKLPIVLVVIPIWGKCFNIRQYSQLALLQSDQLPDTHYFHSQCNTGKYNRYTCYRGPHDIYAPSKVADCPSGYTNMGLTCTNWNGWPWDWHTVGWSYFTCPSGYFKSNVTHRCHKNCPSEYTNTGEFCHRVATSKGMSSMTCPSGYFQSKATARCHKNCPSGYTNMGETCHRPVSTLGLSAMTCNAGEHKGGVAGERCYPNNGMCFNDGDYDAGLCYPKCKDGFDGVGPVCWGYCDNSMVNCGLSCGKTTADCIIAAADQTISVLILAANIASLGLATPATAGAAATINIGGKTVAGTTKVGKALVKAVTKLQTIKPGGLAKGASVMKRIISAKTGKTYKSVITTTKVSLEMHEAMNTYREAFAEEFAEQTSADIEAELDSNFHPITAKFLKGLWGDRMMNDLAEANNWAIASNALGLVSIVDITGVTGVVSAYAKPICNAVVPFPCTDSNISGC